MTGAAGGQETFQCRADVARIGTRRGRSEARREHRLRGARLHIQGKRGENGPRPSRDGGPDGTLEQLRDPGGLVHLDLPLGDRLEEPHEVDLLEGLAVRDRVGHLADQGEHGHGLGLCVVDADRQVRGTGTTGGQADPDPAARPGIAVRHEGGDLLMADRDVADARLERQRVDQVHDRRARQSEDMLDALAPQRLHSRLGSVHLLILVAAGAPRAWAVVIS
ncbi:MAG: hypothetical protein JWO67_3679 [Streptosporangiaceae bacterium]|nr:hypothetical protein [Streptosporangiaceae bacterium]